jgi:AraC family transcriptional regulator of adaptative response / DNA-3-methyladenine glycosylase II
MNRSNSILGDKDACYAVFCAHDTRFDGRVFVGVMSTGIYCRPVCRVKTPKFEHCSFYGNAAAAEAAGFRPCLKCRPELAPGLSAMDTSKRLAGQAAFRIAKDGLFDRSLANLASSLNVTDRHLRRVFMAEFGISPVQYLQTRRLLLAKSLLTDTRLPVSQVALTAGFGSLRRFNDLFKCHYRLPPTALRKTVSVRKQAVEQEITLRLGYRPPYRWDEILSFLAVRAIPGVESATENVYRRTVSMQSGNTCVRGWMSVQNDSRKNQLLVTFSPSLMPSVSELLARVRVLFDLDCEPLEIYDRLSVMNEFAAGLCVPGTRLPGCFDPFEMAVRAVLGQQITVKAARTLAMRLAVAFGEQAETPYGDLTVFFPSAETVCRLPGRIEDQFGPIGITGMKARSILALGRAMASGSIALSRYADPETEMAKLMALPGIGPWTAQYIAMRGLSWPDAFPHTDYGVKKALRDMPEKEILKISEAWRPWRSYATMNLWRSLS